MFVASLFFVASYEVKDVRFIYGILSKFWYTLSAHLREVHVLLKTVDYCSSLAGYQLFVVNSGGCGQPDGVVLNIENTEKGKWEHCMPTLHSSKELVKQFM